MNKLNNAQLELREMDELANSGWALKLKMKGLAKLLVICRLTPSSMEKMKNSAIFFCLKRVKAFKPRASIMVFFSLPTLTGQ